MTTGQLVDLIRDHFVLLGSADAENITWRKRILERIQETVDENWDDEDWDWRQKTTTGTLTAATDSVDGPSDFSTVGKHGGLFLQIGSEWERIDPLAPALLLQRRERNRNSSGCPDYYAVIEQDTDFLTQIIFDRPADTGYSYRLYYEATAPLLLDRPTALTAAEGSAGNPNGAYLYKVVFVGTDSTKSEAGDASTSLTVSSKQISLTEIPTGTSSTESREIYRTAAGGSTYKLLTTLSDNTTTTYTDNIADGSLGAELSTDSTLKKIPAQYHRNVLQRGTIAKLSGDATEQQRYAENTRRMKSRRQHGQESPERMGGGGYGAWGMH